MMRHAARVSIVGSREACQEVVRRARRLSSLLGERGVVVVSGLAKGIDTAAHTGALQSSGKTVAVIGTPLDKSYPKENAARQARAGSMTCSHEGRVCGYREPLEVTHTTADLNDLTHEPVPEDLAAK